MKKRVRPVTVDHADATQAAETVLQRRTSCRPEDPDLWLFPDPEDLLGVVDYVHRRQRVPAEVLAADALAQLRILNYLAGELDRNRMYAIRLARRTGSTWREIAGNIGAQSPQSAEQTLLRLESLFGGDEYRRSESAGRELRRRPRRAPTTGPDARVLRTRPDSTTADLRASLGELLKHRDDIDDEDLAENLTWLRRETSERFAELAGAELAGQLRLIAEEMRGRGWTPPVQAALDRMLAALKM